MRRLVRAAGYLLFGLVVLLVAIRLRFGGGRRLEDRTTAPALPASALEVVAELDHPPGQHRRLGDRTRLLHLPSRRRTADPGRGAGRRAPRALGASWGRRVRRRPSRSASTARGGSGCSTTPASVAASPGSLAFDLATNALVHRYDFPSDVAGFLSMLNDFQVDPAGERIYIAESSPILQRPALIVYDVAKQESRRVLDGHPSVQAEDYVIQTAARDMVLFGIYTLRIGVDSIALDRRGEWLYYGPVDRRPHVPRRRW